VGWICRPGCPDWGDEHLRDYATERDRDRALEEARRHVATQLVAAVAQQWGGDE
jgi:hypothetical protein